MPLFDPPQSGLGSHPRDVASETKMDRWSATLADQRTSWTTGVAEEAEDHRYSDAGKRSDPPFALDHRAL